MMFDGVGLNGHGDNAKKLAPFKLIKNMFTIRNLIGVLVVIVVIIVDRQYCLRSPAESSDVHVAVDHVHAPVDNFLTLAEGDYQRNLVRRSIMPEYRACVANNTACTRVMFMEAFLYPLYPCLREMGVGKVNEGGKWVCNVPGVIKNDTAVVYSVGSNRDTSFERAIHEYFRVSSHTFDPTLPAAVQAEVKATGYIKFHEIGLTGEDNPEDAKKLIKMRLSKGAEMKRLEDIMADLGHDYVDIFKIDCEGCEISLFNALAKKFTRANVPIGQLLIEVHHLKWPNISIPLFTQIESLGFRAFHVEQNFVSGSCYELAYIHESLVIPGR